MNRKNDIVILENTIRKLVSENKAEDTKKEIQAAYDAVKAVKKKLKKMRKTNKQTNVLKSDARKMVDEIEELEDVDNEEDSHFTNHPKDYATS